MEPSSDPTTPQHSFTTNNCAFQCDQWELKLSTLPVLQDIPVSESLFSVGNGFLGVRGFPEESDSMLNASYFRGHEGNKSNMSNIGTVGATNNGSNQSGRQLSNLAGSPTGANNSMEDSMFAAATSQAHPQSTFPVTGMSYFTNNAGHFAPVQACRACYVAGFCEHRLLQNRPKPFNVGQCARESFLVRVPNPFCVDVFVGGEHVCSATGKVTAHSRRLDLRTGELQRRIVWESHSQTGREVTIESRRFVSVVRKNIAAFRLTVTAKNVNNTDIRILSRTDVPDDVATKRSCGLENVFTRFDIQEAVSVVQVRTHISCKHLVVVGVDTCNSSLHAEGGKKQFSAANMTSAEGSGSATGSFSSPSQANASSGTPIGFNGGRDAPPGARAFTSLAPKCNDTDHGTETLFTSCISDHVQIQLTKFAGFYTDDDALQEELGDLAVQRTHATAQMGYDAAFMEHRVAMGKLWETADVRFNGSRSIQGAFRYNMLQLFMSYDTSSLYGFPTRGITGENMGGVHQWDVDAFIVPALTHTMPDKARALLQFRINTLYQAKNIANDLDLPRGAVYPFRTITGTENPVPYCAAFLFVNAVIACAMRQYVVATNDYSIIADGGAEVVLSTAIVWLEWGTWEKGRFHIRSVAGPDMYAGNVDDSFFTNVMAQQHMQWTVQIAAYLRETWLVRWNEVLEHSLATEDDVAELDRAAASMVIPFDGEHRVFPVDESFMRKKKWSLEDFNTSQRESLLHRFNPSVIYRHQICRIPDVLLAMLFQPELFTHDDYHANFSFYDPITSNDSALRHVVNTIIAAHLRLDEKAMTNFTSTLFVDICNVIGNTGGGLHCTTAAGGWWALAVGYGGMRVLQGTLHFHPTLPTDCEGFTFFARHRGCVVKVAVTERMVTYSLESSTPASPDLLLIHAETNRIHLRLGTPETVRLFREVHVFNFDCVLFEMDSIIVNVEMFHYEAWRETLETYFHENDMPSFTLSKDLYLAYMRHNKPISGLAEIFKRVSRQPLPPGHSSDTEDAKTANGLIAKKLMSYRHVVKEKGMHFREGTFQLLANLRERGIMVGCVSGSKNGRWILEETPQLRFVFDDFIDRNSGEENGFRWRPEMDYFDACAKSMDCTLDRTVLVLDGTDGFSKSCIEKYCMVVDVSEEPEQLALEIPRVNMANFNGLTVEVLDEGVAPGGVPHHQQSATVRKTARNSFSGYGTPQASPNMNVNAFPDMTSHHTPPGVPI